MTTVQFSGVTFDDTSSSGFHLSKLVGWDDGAPARYSADERPQGNGTFRPGTIYRGARVVSVEGTWNGPDLQSAYQARYLLASLQADGQESPFVVTDLLGSKRITAGITSAPTMDDGLYQPFFAFAFDVVAADPFRYGEPVSGSSGPATASSGLVWPLGLQQSGGIVDGMYPTTYFAPSSEPGFYGTDGLTDAGGGFFNPPSYSGSGTYFDWGTAGTSGRVELTNVGTAAAFPSFEVTGGMSGGFLLTWVPTGQTIRFERPIDSASTVSVDPRTGRVSLDGTSDVTGFLTSSQWWSVPAGGSGEVQFTPLGTVAGSPTLTARLSPAYV